MSSCHKIPTGYIGKARRGLSYRSARRNAKFNRGPILGTNSVDGKFRTYPRYLTKVLPPVNPGKKMRNWSFDQCYDYAMWRENRVVPSAEKFSFQTV